MKQELLMLLLEWRKVENNQTNAPLFKEENKKRLFEELASAKKIPIYKADSDVFKETFKVRDRKQLLNQEKKRLIPMSKY